MQLADLYFFGKGMAKDEEQAVYWYSKAAEQGIVDAQYNLGVCYYNGEGVAKDKDKAKYWLEKSASQGYEPAKDVLLKTF